MKDIFTLVDSFGILSLLFSNKEKYKGHRLQTGLKKNPLLP